MEALIKFKGLNSQAHIPTKREEDAGFDIYGYGVKIIPPHSCVQFHTGLMSAFSKEWVGIIKERGSTGSIGMAVRSGVIDSGYRGEWLICINNTNDYPIEIGDVKKTEFVTKRNGKIKKVIYPKTKAIAQVIFLPVPKYTVKPIVNGDDVDMNMNTERGASGWGASGK